MFGWLFHLSGRQARERAEALLSQFRLQEAADWPVKTYSGGMRRRIDLAASMILAPQVLFLDEPTTGLDPQGRAEVWDAIRSLRDGGTTVLLTTHYLDEADQLSDRIAVMDKDRKITDDTPAHLKRAVGADRIEIVTRQIEDVPLVAQTLERVVAGDDPQVVVVPGNCTLRSTTRSGQWRR